MKLKNRVLSVAFLLTSLNAFAVPNAKFGESCLIADEEASIQAALKAKNELMVKIEALALNWRAIGIGVADVGASKNCNALDVTLDQQTSVEHLRGQIGDFYQGFPILYSVGDEIRAQ